MFATWSEGGIGNAYENTLFTNGQWRQGKEITQFNRVVMNHPRNELEEGTIATLCMFNLDNSGVGLPVDQWRNPQQRY